MKNKISSYFNLNDFPQLLFRYPRLLWGMIFINQITVLRNWYVRRGLKKVMKQFSTSFTMFDAGSGMGDFIFLQSQKNKNCTFIGIDSSPANISLSDKFIEATHQTNTSFTCGDLQTIEFPANVNVLLCNTVLQYIPNDATVLQKFYSALAPNGKLVIYVPVNYHRKLLLYKALLSKPNFNYDTSVGRAHTYTSETIKDKILSAGFTIDEVQFSYGKYGAIAYEIFSIFQWLLRVIPFYLLPIVIIVYSVFIFPTTLVLMAIDYCSNNNEGNGCLIIASKK